MKRRNLLERSADRFWSVEHGGVVDVSEVMIIVIVAGCTATVVMKCAFPRCSFIFIRSYVFFFLCVLVVVVVVAVASLCILLLEKCTFII